MTTDSRHEISSSRDWLRLMAEQEDQYASISAAGLAADLGLLKIEAPAGSLLFARFIQLGRRAQGLSVEELAERAQIDISQLVAIESEGAAPVPRTVYQLSKVLKVSTGKLMELAGLAKSKDPEFRQAALRFAARSEPSAKLSDEEREAFEEFVKVLVEASD